MIINKESKHAMWDMIYDLDNHFPDEVLTDEYYKWFYNRYIKPILKTQGIADRLNITNIKTIRQLNSIDWKKYSDTSHDNWIKYICYPITQSGLNNICKLSKVKGSKIVLFNSMGELFSRPEGK